MNDVSNLTFCRKGNFILENELVRLRALINYSLFNFLCNFIFYETFSVIELKAPANKITYYRIKYFILTLCKIAPQYGKQILEYSRICILFSASNKCSITNICSFDKCSCNRSGT